MEQQGRDVPGTKRFIIISCLFFFCVLTGGGFLIVYVFLPDVSQPWYPNAALVLIGLPWLFWLLTYIYTCIKACYVGRHPNKDRDAAQTRKLGGGNNGQRHVHFGGATTLGREADKNNNNNNNNGQEDGGGDCSIGSRESEIPLTSSGS